jgi:hypothetical protein
MSLLAGLTLHCKKTLTEEQNLNTTKAGQAITCYSYNVEKRKKTGANPKIEKFKEFFQRPTVLSRNGSGHSNN